MTNLMEAVTKATQTANLLFSDIREAYSAASRGGPGSGLAEILFTDLLAESVNLENKLNRIKTAMKVEDLD